MLGQLVATGLGYVLPVLCAESCCRLLLNRESRQEDEVSDHEAGDVLTDAVYHAKIRLQSRASRSKLHLSEACELCIQRTGQLQLSA